MSLLKRKISEPGLYRRVRARRETSEELEAELSEQSTYEDLPAAVKEGSNNSESTETEDEDDDENEVCIHGIAMLSNLINS